MPADFRPPPDVDPCSPGSARRRSRGDRDHLGPLGDAVGPPGTSRDRSPGQSAGTGPPPGRSRSETTSPVAASWPWGRIDPQQAAVRRERGDLPLVGQVIGLGEDDLGLVRPGDGVVVAEAEVLDDVVLDPVARAAVGQDEEPPGLAARARLAWPGCPGPRRRTCRGPRTRRASTCREESPGKSLLRTARARRRTRSGRRGGCCRRSVPLRALVRRIKPHGLDPLRRVRGRRDPRGRAGSGRC